MAMKKQALKNLLILLLLAPQVFILTGESIAGGLSSCVSPEECQEQVTVEIEEPLHLLEILY